jgi:hypothetical protein
LVPFGETSPRINADVAIDIGLKTFKSNISPFYTHKPGSNNVHESPFCNGEGFLKANLPSLRKIKPLLHSCLDLVTYMRIPVA